MTTPHLPPPAVAAAPSITTAATPVAAPEASAAPSPPLATHTAQQVAGAILEVLAGVRSITDAALVLGVTPARYYVLEARAVEGLIAACEPRSPGPATGNALVAEVDRLRAERDRLRDEAARYQALARIAQVAFGPAGVQPAAPAGSAAAQRAGRTAVLTAAGRPRKKRTPTVRALRLAQQVQQQRQPPPAALPHPAASPAPAPLATPGPAAGG